MSERRHQESLGFQVWNELQRLYRVVRFMSCRLSDKNCVYFMVLRQRTRRATALFGEGQGIAAQAGDRQHEEACYRAAWHTIRCGL